MGRPPLPVGTWGAVRTEPTPTGYRARARFRDFDGRTREIERTRRTKGAARSAVTAALAERTAPAGDTITSTTRLHAATEIWQDEKRAQRDAGKLAVATMRRYDEVIADHITPALGDLMLSECSVTRVDRFFKTTTTNTGAPTAKLCRTVLSGILGMAVRHGALPTNPVREAAPITIAKPTPQALTIEDVHAARRAVAAYQTNRATRGRPASPDTLDMLDLIITTGARTGEALAIRWADVDLDAGTVSFTGTVARDKHGAFIRQGKTKSDTSRRRLRLPTATTTMLLRRHVNAVPTVDDLVFPSDAGTVRDPSNFRKTLARALRPDGLQWITPRHFRRTVATVIDRAAGLQSASHQLGHADTRITSKHYVERLYDGPDVRDALDGLVIDA